MRPRSTSATRSTTRSSSTTHATPLPLAAGERTTRTGDPVAAAGDGPSYKNEACAQGIDTLGGPNGTVSDCDDVTVPILHPGINVTKKADESSVHVGETIHYTI